MSSQDRILTALKDARTKLEAAERDKTEPIAVIGIGCRFPGQANTPDAYWKLLRGRSRRDGRHPRRPVVDR